ncbi:MAG: hypothetical protein V3V00_13590 [Saprospiraceae bacterium]
MNESVSQDNWQFNFEWLRVRTFLKDSLGHSVLPDFQEILFLIGLQELGRLQDSFTKEEKQDLIHIATCELLSKDGFYQFKGRDQDGWPHYDHIKNVPFDGAIAQEQYLKQKITEYFNKQIQESES